ncbi:TnsA-like heteromeric transposase endonuclease subunit [Deinococcus sp. NW-56]|uniref:TnsA-like heteromeric transposase endonuclease subunit n=1 Tax=Deinococcus sp. NW-56 TaxID=2080419 RepID=UPI00131A04C9|nr:TnsA-like heteromeric transposase endonuclease subunit [Deinococcus sp. NW-56]
MTAAWPVTPSPDERVPPDPPQRSPFAVLYRPVGALDLLRGEPAVLRGLSPFDLEPAREVPNYHGQQGRVGWYASAKMGAHLRFESGLERLRMQFLDFDPGVTAFAAQPFTLEWTEGGKTYHYTPDLLIVRPGRPRLVEDVKPAAFHGSPRLQRAFGAARDALAPVGVDFGLWASPETTVVRNVQYLAGYRHAPRGLTTYLKPVLAALRDRPRTLAELAERTGPPALTRPVIYHLIWAHRVHFDLTQPLSHGTVLSRAPQPGEAT